MAQRVRSVLMANGAEHVMVFCGDDGLDELTTTTTSHVYEYRNGETLDYVVDPIDYGIARASHADLLGGDAARNATVIDAVLGGSRDAARDIAVLNAAAALQVADLATDWDEGIALAELAIDSGRAASTLDAWRTVALAVAAQETA